VNELFQSDLAKVADWNLSMYNPDLSQMPSRDTLIAFLALFRQFFMHQSEPVFVPSVAATLRQLLNDQELIDAIGQIETASPYGYSMSVRLSGRDFSPEDYARAWVSRYFHSDAIPPELERLEGGANWQFSVFPLVFTFRQGSNILDALRAVILEAHSRGLIAGEPAK
jgi:hypothetical protein